MLKHAERLPMAPLAPTHSKVAGRPARGVPPQPKVKAAASPAQGVLRALLHHRIGVSGLLLTLFLLTIALLAPVLAPHDPLVMVPADRFAAPSLTYPFGTDEFGRDLFSRLLFAGRTAFFVGITSVAVATTIGVAIGLITGYLGGAVDTVVMRFFDALLAFPTILLAIVILAVLGPGVLNAVLAVAIINIPVFARLTRANVLAERHKEYVEAARAVGLLPQRILLRTILPNTLGTVIIRITEAVAGAVLLESALSFLGLGVPLPAPSWGSMMSIGRGYMTYAPWYALAPGMALMLLVLGVYLLGDGLNHVLDPRRHRRY
jgi:peptide/nickel transport system permease protein